jgi:hypothetical protein
MGQVQLEIRLRRREWRRKNLHCAPMTELPFVFTGTVNIHVSGAIDTEG